MHVTLAAQRLRSELDTVILDMDGVLIDISQSIRVVNCLAVPFYLRECVGLGATDNLISSSDIEMFKNAGGFNDDWDLTYALVLHYLVKHRENGDADADTLNILGPSLTRFATRIKQKGGGLKAAEEISWGHYDWREREQIERQYNKPLIRQVFEELFAGDLCERLYGRPAKLYLGEGYIYRDQVLLNKEKLPTDMKLGMQTGRTYEEAVLGLEFCGLRETISDDRCVTKRDGFHKPEPGGLALILKRLGAETGGVYIGDTLDDLKTVRNLNALGKYPPVLAALVLTGPAGKANEASFKRSGADVVANDVNEVLDWLNAAR